MIDMASAVLFGCTCGRLRKLTRAVTQTYDRFLEPTGLTIQQFGILAPLHQRGDMSMGELADHLVNDATTLTRSLRPLERDGLIKIATAKDDRRRRAVSITAKGKQVFQSALPMWREAQKKVADTLGDDLYKTLNSSLVRSLEELRS
jgi:DNA-binding MarR family transcriptional regulator